MSETLNFLQRVFVPERNEKLVDCLGRAYESSADYFAPQVGHDGMVFGLMVYKSNTHFLSELSYKEDWLEILSRSPRFLMQIEKYRIATYKVGDTLDIDPRFSFPNNRVGAYELTKANLTQRFLFAEMNSEDHEISDIHCTNLILAHSGNSEEGLLRVFFGIPSKIDEKKQIVEWSTVFEIWSREKDGDSSLFVSKSDEPKVPTEKVEPPTLKLKVKQRKDGTKSGS
ncbi:MAG TPA: hypothetical protein VGC97_02020 [Pyrinomonadaceae bacterium]|jgi:hypothetical protein